MEILELKYDIDLTKQQEKMKKLQSLKELNEKRHKIEYCKAFRAENSPETDIYSKIIAPYQDLLKPKEHIRKSNRCSGTVLSTNAL